jgi:hypothetical protein
MCVLVKSPKKSGFPAMGQEICVTGRQEVLLGAGSAERSAFVDDSKCCGAVRLQAGLQAK